LRRSTTSRLIAALLLASLVPIATACGFVAESLDAMASSQRLAAPPSATPPAGDGTQDSVVAPVAGEAPAADPRATSGEALPPAAASWMQQPFEDLSPGDPAAIPSRGEVATPFASTGGALDRTAVAVAPTPEAPGDQATAGMAQVRESVLDSEPEDYDPWERYNEWMFTFNYNVDRYVLKPAANVYRHLIPEPFQLMIANGFDNIRYPARLVNHLLQLRFWGAFIETSRFVINSTLGLGGLFNPATDYFGINKSRADFGQTLLPWGEGPGPYFVPPLLPPATVRDFIGRLADSAINPISWYLLDFWPEAFAIGTGEMVNERALNYEVFQGVEETTLDLYTAVRDAYLRRRERQLRLDGE